MFIGHVPAGYLLSRYACSFLKSGPKESNSFILWGVLGSIAPDVDMLYFYLVDHRQHHHHTYVTHFPLIWATALTISLLWLISGRNRRTAMAAAFFIGNGLIHMLLDSLVGDIWWFAPFIDKPYALFTVPALYKPWWINFIFHWSFAVELGVVLWAFHLWRHRGSVGNSEDAAI